MSNLTYSEDYEVHDSVVRPPLSLLLLTVTCQPVTDHIYSPHRIWRVQTVCHRLESLYTCSPALSELLPHRRSDQYWLLLCGPAGGEGPVIHTRGAGGEGEVSWGHSGPCMLAGLSFHIAPRALGAVTFGGKDKYELLGLGKISLWLPLKGTIIYFFLMGIFF